MKKLQIISLAFLLSVSSSHFMNSMEGPTEVSQPTVEKSEGVDKSEQGGDPNDIAPSSAKIANEGSADGSNPMKNKSGTTAVVDADSGDSKDGSLTVADGDSSSDKQSLKDKMKSRSKSLWKRLVSDPFKKMATKISDLVDRLLVWARVRPQDGRKVLERATGLADISKASDILRSVGENENWTPEQFADAKEAFRTKLQEMVEKGTISQKRMDSFLDNFAADKVGRDGNDSPGNLDALKSKKATSKVKKAQAQRQAKAEKDAAQRAEADKSAKTSKDKKEQRQRRQYISRAATEVLNRSKAGAKALKDAFKKRRGKKAATTTSSDS